MEICELCLKDLQKVTEKCKPVSINLLHRGHIYCKILKMFTGSPLHFLCLAVSKVQVAGTLGSMFSLHIFEGNGSYTSGLLVHRVVC